MLAFSVTKFVSYKLYNPGIIFPTACSFPLKIGIMFPFESDCDGSLIKVFVILSAELCGRIILLFKSDI